MTFIDCFFAEFFILSFPWLSPLSELLPGSSSPSPPRASGPWARCVGTALAAELVGLGVGKQTSYKYTQLTYYVYLFVWHKLWRSIGFYIEVQFGFHGISRGKSTTGDLTKQNGNMTNQFGCYACYLARRVWRVSVSRCGFLYPNP